MLETALRLTRARLIITTLGKRGSLLLERPAQPETRGPSVSLQSVIDELSAQLPSSSQTGAQGGCLSKTKVDIKAQGVLSTSAAAQLSFTSGRDASAAQQQLQGAASRAAALNADATKASAYTMAPADSAAGQQQPVVANVMMASAASLPDDAVVDTTGAGDAFIGTVLYGLSTGMKRYKMLQLAAVVAACKCTMLGARPGLPLRSQISADTLQ